LAFVDAAREDQRAAVDELQVLVVGQKRERGFEFAQRAVGVAAEQRIGTATERTERFGDVEQTRQLVERIGVIVDAHVDRGAARLAFDRKAVDDDERRRHRTAGVAARSLAGEQRGEHARGD